MLSALTPTVPERDSIEIEMGNEFLNAWTRWRSSCLYCKFSIRSALLSWHNHLASDSQSFRQDGPFRLYKAFSWLWFKLLWLALLLDYTKTQQVIEIGPWNQQHASFWKSLGLSHAYIFFWAQDQVWKLFFESRRMIPGARVRNGLQPISTKPLCCLLYLRNWVTWLVHLVTSRPVSCLMMTGKGLLRWMEKTECLINI